MANTGTIRLTGTVTGQASGDKNLAAEWDLTAAVVDVNTVSLASGDNTITVPTGATVMLFIPPTSNAETIKIKGAAGDTGFTISPTKPTVFTYAAGAIILNASGTVAGCEINWA